MCGSFYLPVVNTFYKRICTLLLRKYNFQQIRKHRLLGGKQQQVVSHNVNTYLGQ